MFLEFSSIDIGVIKSQIKVSRSIEFSTESCFVSLPSQVRVNYHFPLKCLFAYIHQVIIYFFRTHSDALNDRFSIRI